MYFKRTLENSIKKASESFPVVLVTGARQVGKTTVLKACEKDDRNYVTLDNPLLREFAKSDPELFLERYSTPLLIDEIQYAPELLPYIKMIVDEKQEKGLFWLTGSQQFHLMKNVGESLAGRVAILNLLGFSQNEKLEKPERPGFIPNAEYFKVVRNDSAKLTLNEVYEMIYKGSYPAMNIAANTDWEMFYSSYLQTYIERDIRDLKAISDEQLFLKFIKIVASRTAQVLNYSDFANATGVSVPTIKSWISLLVTSGIIYLLEPYYNNISSRSIKSPKLYFFDTGLCAYLTSWSSAKVLEAGAMSGAFFETYVVSEIIKSYWHNGKRAPMYYYRDKDKKEIDLLIEYSGVLHPIEIKKTSKPDKAIIKQFDILNNKNINRGEGGIICLSSEFIPLSKKDYIIPISYV
jgi:uncharacterized protein